MRQHIDHVPVRITNEEAFDAPRLSGSLVDDVCADLSSTAPHESEVLNINRDVWVDDRRCVGRDERQLPIRPVRRAHRCDPAKIHSGFEIEKPGKEVDRRRRI